jgi:hypothetical protein
VEGASNGASDVSPQALGAFLAEELIEMPGRTFLRLYNLGLNNNHCKVMAQVLARNCAFLLRPIEALDLTENPSIGRQGYVALLGLLNRGLNIGTVVVDDQNWKATFNLVILMNVEYRRGQDDVVDNMVAVILDWIRLD